MKTTKSIILTLVAVILSTGCKYEEGPAISLRTKKARMENTWNIEKAMDDGEDVTDSYDNYTLRLDKTGDASLTASYSYGPFAYTGTTDGTWDFTNDKNDLKLDFEDDDADMEFQILKLTNEELWLREKGEDLELHLR
jgi:hypothetical protein